MRFRDRDAVRGKEDHGFHPPSSSWDWDWLPSAVFCKFILTLPRQVHKIDNALSRKPVVAVGGKDSIRHDADGLRSGQAGLQFLCVSDAYGNACPIKRQEETDRLNRPGLRKTGHHQIVAMRILVYDAVDVGAVAAPAYLPGVTGAGTLLQPPCKSFGGISVQLGQSLVPPIGVESVLLFFRFLRSSVSHGPIAQGTEVIEFVCGHGWEPLVIFQRIPNRRGEKLLHLLLGEVLEELLLPLWEYPPQIPAQDGSGSMPDGQLPLHQFL